MKKNKPNKNIQILSIEGKDIINSNYNYKLKSNKKFKAALDFSLETKELKKLCKNVFYIDKDSGKLRTKKVINLTFKYGVKEFYDLNLKKQKVWIRYDNIQDPKDLKFINGLHFNEKDQIDAVLTDCLVDYIKTDKLLIKLPKGFKAESNKDNTKVKIIVDKSKLKTIYKPEQIREKLYESGFILDGKDKFVRFKRSGGSSRIGKCLFVAQSLYDNMEKWSLMGLDIKNGDEVDLAGLEAYKSLTLSSCINYIDISPKSILLIDDYESIFEDDVMATTIDDNNRLKTEPAKVEISNKIWDGQSLLDSSVFDVNGYKDKGYLLLRNRYFKSACFSSNIQEYFKDNGITDLSQLNGVTFAQKIEDIKLITTKSSIKYLKFGKFEDYIKQLDPKFGVVKYDKPTKYFNGDLVQLHYQLLNTLQLDKNEVAELLEPSLDYINQLKNDIRVFRHHLKIKIDSDIENLDKVEVNSTNEMMLTLLQVNDKFINTDLFVKFRQDVTESSISNMLRGHLLTSGNYSVLLGNPLEMLKDSIKAADGKSSVFNGESCIGVDEVINLNFAEGQELLACRSPHVTMGNLLLVKNVRNKEIEKYFNLTERIVVVNSIGNNILERLSSADFDSDQVLLTDNNLLINSARKNYDKFLVPTNCVKSKPTTRFYTLKQLADLDNKTSKNLIGEIVNCSQILNSKLWHMISQGNTQKEIDDLYAVICQLDVMSTIEIDKAKKEFVVNNKKELDDIRKKYIGKNKPKFFKEVAKGKKYKAKGKYESFNTAMDFLVTIAKKELKKIRSTRRDCKANLAVSLKELMTVDDIKLADANRKQVKKLIDDCRSVRANIKNIWNDKNLENEEKYIKANELKNNFIAQVAKLPMRQATVKKIVNDIADDDKLKGVNRMLLSVLFSAHKDKILGIFKQNKTELEFLERTERTDSKPDIKLYNLNFSIIKKIV